MLKKIVGLLNVKAWLEGVLVSKLIAKGVKGASAALLGVLTSPYFVAKVQPILETLGVSIDQNTLQASVVVLLTGVTASVMNWIKTKANQ